MLLNEDDSGAPGVFEFRGDFAQQFRPVGEIVAADDRLQTAEQNIE